MKKYIVLVSLFLALPFGSDAQDIVKSLEEIVPGQGRVIIHQDGDISALLRREGQTVVDSNSETQVIKRPGYRIQVYAGNNTRNAKNEAYAEASRVREVFPELNVYTSFIPPRWLCRVGDFRTIEEADAVMRRLRESKVFKEVSIVKDQINISY